MAQPHETVRLLTEALTVYIGYVDLALESTDPETRKRRMRRYRYLRQRVIDCLHDVDIYMRDQDQQQRQRKTAGGG